MESPRPDKVPAAIYWKSINAAVPQAMVTTILSQPFRNIQLLQQTANPGGINMLVPHLIVCSNIVMKEHLVLDRINHQC